MAVPMWSSRLLVLTQLCVMTQPMALSPLLQSACSRAWPLAAPSGCAVACDRRWPTTPARGKPRRASLLSNLRARSGASHDLARWHSRNATGREDDLDQLQALLGYAFSNRRVLAQAVTHRSAATQSLDSNQRLEYLGDAVLGMLVAEHLFQTFPGFDEGRLSTIRKEVVSASALAQVARRQELGRFARLNPGEEATGGRNKEALLADLVEALVAAIFVDGGLDAARVFVLRWFQEDIQLASRDPAGSDFKSKLQEHLRRIQMPDPVYHVVETGPKHNQKFTAHAMVVEARLGWGTGKSKKAAEQAAAQYSIQLLEQKNPSELSQWRALANTNACLPPPQVL